MVSLSGSPTISAEYPTAVLGSEKKVAYTSSRHGRRAPRRFSANDVTSRYRQLLHSRPELLNMTLALWVDSFVRGNDLCCLLFILFYFLIGEQALKTRPCICSVTYLV